MDKENFVDEDGAYFVPFCRQVEDYYRLLKEVPDDSVVFTHMPLEEALPPGASISQELVRQKDFNRFRAVYSGDIHRPGKFGKVVYVGTPSQRDWRDKNSSGAYGIISEDGKYSSIPSYPPVHLEVEDRKDIPKDKKCIVKCPPELDLSGYEHVVSRVSSSGAKAEHFEVPQSVLTPSEDLEQYVGANPLQGVDKETLLEYGKQVFEEGSSG